MNIRERTESIFCFSVFIKKLLKLIFSCNKSITLIALTLLLLKCFHAEGNNNREKEKKKKRKEKINFRISVITSVDALQLDSLQSLTVYGPQDQPQGKAQAPEFVLSYLSNKPTHGRASDGLEKTFK